MPSSYYFWKWADNDLPGKPPEVWVALLRGEMHPALQSFDATSLLNALEDAATEAREVGEEWEWKVHPPAAPEKAWFVFLTCPRIKTSKARMERFVDRFLPLGVSGCDDEGGKLLPGLNPKLNYFVTGQLSDCDIFYDITADELPFLLRRIRPRGPSRGANCGHGGMLFRRSPKAGALEWNGWNGQMKKSAARSSNGAPAIPNGWRHWLVRMTPESRLAKQTLTSSPTPTRCVFSSPSCAAKHARRSIAGAG